MKFLFENMNLNPILWDGDKLKPEVRDKLLQIKDKFILGLEENDIPAVIVDVCIVGSNANYNYNTNSDLDLHIIVDLSEFDKEERKMLQLIYNYYKSAFNDKYSIFIKNISVELYIEDVRTRAISNGVYSILSDSWILQPRYIEKVNVDISKPLAYMISRFEEVKLAVAIV